MPFRHVCLVPPLVELVVGNPGLTGEDPLSLPRKGGCPGLEFPEVSLWHHPALVCNHALQGTPLQVVLVTVGTAVKGRASVECNAVLLALVPGRQESLHAGAVLPEGPESVDVLVLSLGVILQSEHHRARIVAVDPTGRQLEEKGLPGLNGCLHHD